MNIKNVVFDVGQVLVDFRWHEYMQDLGFPEAEIDELGGRMVMSRYWHELDLGIQNEEDAPEYFSSIMPQYKNEIKLFWKRIEEIVVPFSYSGPMVRKIKEQGYKVYLLSNYPVQMAKVHWAKMDFMDELDGYIISAQEHLSKPDPAIYRLLEKKFGIDLTESVFIDDREDNVAAAGKLGMKEILFTGYDDLRKSLDLLGISIP